MANVNDETPNTIRALFLFLLAAITAASANVPSMSAICLVTMPSGPSKAFGILCKYFARSSLLVTDEIRRISSIFPDAYAQRNAFMAGLGSWTKL